VVVKYTLGYSDVDINDLANLITRVITGKERERDTQKRIRENIVYALNSGALKETSNKCVDASEFFKWARSYKKWNQYWPDIQNVEGLPAVNLVMKAEGGSISITGNQTDLSIIPGDRETLQELYIESRKVNKVLSATNEELIKGLNVLKKELDRHQTKEMRRKHASSEGGRKSKGKKKNF
jgi:hypothetical protein